MTNNIKNRGATKRRRLSSNRMISPLKANRGSKKTWFEKNIKSLLIIVIILFIGQSFRGCINTSSLNRKIKNINIINDSIRIEKNRNIENLQDILSESQKENQRLIYELKIAGVKADEAEKRAKAIQRTAEKIKQNTTITIEADTSRNKIK